MSDSAVRIAALYDIHGNLPALEAVLEEVLATKVDLVVVGGDVVPGPMPRETLAALRGLPFPTRFIFGNGETDVLAMRAGQTVDRVPEPVREVVRWSGDVLAPEEADFLAGWPATTRIDIPAFGDVLFCHATPESDAEVVTRLTPDADLVSAFDAADASLVICGHTHMPFDREVRDIRVVNAGSVGMPFGEPGAYWLLIGSTAELRRTPYDLEAAAERIRATDYPKAHEFADRYVLRPPTESEMLELFERAAGR